MNTTELNPPKVAVVILNYNSEKDLKTCAEQVALQRGVEFSIILVDNASNQDSVKNLRTWLSGWRPNATRGNEREVNEWVKNNPKVARESGQVFLIENHENRGYSAGNNIGIRLADILGVDAVLIANPDMQIENPNYLAELSATLFSDPQYYIAASRILGVDGEDQNPLREATFWEELFWPRWFLSRIFKKISHVIPVTKESVIAVPKVSGCCLMLRMSFLRQINYLDERVFLYCEEPILSAKVKRADAKIVY